MSIPYVFKEAIESLKNLPRSQYHDIISNEEQEIVSKIESEGYRKLGSGTSRLVFLLNNNEVVKIPRPKTENYNGVADNKKEYKQYQKSNTEQKKLLAPVHKVGSNYQWLVMEKSPQIRGHESEITDAFFDQCENANIDLLGDMVGWNVGYIPSNNQDCLIDYGHEVL